MFVLGSLAIVQLITRIFLSAVIGADSSSAQAGQHPEKPPPWRLIRTRFRFVADIPDFGVYTKAWTTPEIFVSTRSTGSSVFCRSRYAFRKRGTPFPARAFGD